MAERFEIVEKALLKMLEEKKYSTLRDILITMNPADVAGLFDGLEEKQIPVMFRLLPKEQAAETFVEMEPEAQQLLIQGFSDNELREVLDELYVDDAADLVEEMPANVVRRILGQADPEMRSSDQPDPALPRKLRRCPDDHGVCIPPAGHDRGGGHPAHPPARVWTKRPSIPAMCWIRTGRCWASSP